MITETLNGLEEAILREDEFNFLYDYTLKIGNVKPTKEDIDYFTGRIDSYMIRSSDEHYSKFNAGKDYITYVNRKIMEGLKN